MGEGRCYEPCGVQRLAIDNQKAILFEMNAEGGSLQRGGNRAVRKGVGCGRQRTPAPAAALDPDTSTRTD